MVGTPSPRQTSDSCTPVCVSWSDISGEWMGDLLSVRLYLGVQGLFPPQHSRQGGEGQEDARDASEVPEHEGGQEKEWKELEQNGLQVLE